MNNYMPFNVTDYNGKITPQYACVNDSSVGYGTDFSVDGDVNGWTYYDGIHTYGCWNNFLFGTLYGDYGIVGKPDVFRPVPAETFTFVKIVMKLNIMERLGNHSTPSFGRIAWLTVADPVWGSSKQIDFNIICDGAWHTYLLNMGEVQWWQGEINNLRIYPILNDGSDGDEFLIKSIEIISTNDYLCNNANCSYYINYQHPCKGVGLRASCASMTEALFAQTGEIFEFSHNKEYTIEENINDELLVNINGYGFEIVKLKHVSNNSGSQLAKMISGEISRTDVGGYAEVEVEYTNRNQFIIYSGTYTNDSSVEIGFNNASIYLGFFDISGTDLSTKTNGLNPANGFKPFSSFKVPTKQVNALLESGGDTTIYFNPDKYNVEGGRVDWLDAGIGATAKDVRGSDTDMSGLLNRTYNMIHNVGKTMIDFSHPFNASGRITKIYAAVTLDTMDSLSNYDRAKAFIPDDSPYPIFGRDLYRESVQLSGAKIMFFRPMRDGSLKVLPIEVPIVDRDYASGKIYSARQEYVELDCDLFVNKGDLIGVYNADIYAGMTITGSEIDGLYYQIVGKASGVLNVSQPLGYGQAGVLIYARSSQRQDRLLLNLDLGKRINVSNLNVIGEILVKQLDYNIARCLDINWEVDMFGGDFTTSHVVQYTPSRLDIFYNHPSVYYGKDCLNDGIKVVTDGVSGDSFSVEMGAGYYSYPAAVHKKDGGITVIVNGAKYFQTNGDCEWLAVYYQIPYPSCPCEPKSCLDFSPDPMAFTIKFPYGKEKLLYKSTIFFKERYNFRSFAISAYRGEWYTHGDADDPRFTLIPNRTDGYDTPWSKITIDGRSYTPENITAWETLHTYLGRNPTVGHEIIRSTGVQEFSVGDRQDFNNIVEYDPLGGLVYYETGIITNNEDYLNTLAFDWTTLEHEWNPIRSQGYRFYCDYHESTKICEFEVYCVVENFRPNLAGMVNIVYSHYGVQWWPSALKETDDENSVSASIQDTPRYINIEITPFTEIRLKAIDIEVSSEDVFMGDKGCNDLLLLDNAKKNHINDSSIINFKNTYGRSYDLYVDIEGGSSLIDKGLIFSSKLNNAESITNPIVGADAYYIKHPDYKLLNYHSNVAVNCPVYSLKNLIDGAKAWCSYDDELSWVYHGELVGTEDINVSNLPYLSITTINLPTIIRSKWWKFGFYDPRISMNVREIKVYRKGQEIPGVKFYHHKGQVDINTSSTDTAVHLRNDNVFGSYYVLNGSGGYIGIELPDIDVIDKIVMYNDNKLDYEKSNTNAGIDHCTALCIRGTGSMYQTDTIKDYSYFEHEVQTVGSGIYCDPSSKVALDYSWSVQASAADNNWNSVCWSPERGLFCAVASTGIGNRVMTSPNGVDWTIRSSAVDNDWTSVCWSPELGLFCAVANTGTGNRVMTSVSGIVWTTQASAADNNWTSVCWSPALNLFAAVANTGTGNRAMTSPNGIDWTTRVSALDNNWTSICWSPELGLFCAVAMTSIDNHPSMISSDGVVWTSGVSDVNHKRKSVCWSPELGIFYCVSNSETTYRSMFSINGSGASWTAMIPPANNDWNSVCWSPTLGLCAVASTGTGNRSMASRNGYDDWTTKTTVVDNGWTSVCWSPELGIFCAVANSGIGNRVIISQMVDILGKSSIRFNGLPGEYLVAKYANNPTCNWIDEGFDFDLKRFTIDFFIKFNTLPAVGQTLIIAKSWLGDPLTSTALGSWALGLENDAGIFRIRFYINNDGVRRNLPLNDYQNVWWPGAPVPGAWYHFSLSRGLESNIGTEEDYYTLYANIPRNINCRGCIDISGYRTYLGMYGSDGYYQYYALETWLYHIANSKQDVIIGENFDGWLSEFRISSSYTPGGGRPPLVNLFFPSYLGYRRLPTLAKAPPTHQFEKYNLFSIYTSEDNSNYGHLVDADILFSTNYSYYSPENKWCRDYNSYFVVDLGQRHSIELIRSFPVDTSYQFTLSDNIKYSNNDTDDVTEAFKVTEEQLNRIRNMDFSKEESTVPKDWLIETTGTSDSYIKENKYYQYADGVNSVTAQVVATSLFYLTDVFDIQIDFELEAISNNNEWAILFSVADVNNSNNVISICRAFTSGVNQYAVYIQDNSGTETKVTYLYSGDSTGSLRIWRSRNSFVMYIKRQDQPEFQILYSYTFINSTVSNSMVVKLSTISKASNYPPVKNYWNNFKIIDGAIEYYSFYQDARWLKIVMPNDGTTYTIKRVGVYPDVSVQTTADGKYNTYWNYLGASITDYTTDDNIAFGATVSGSSFVGLMILEHITDNIAGSDMNLCWGSDAAAIQWITICLNEIQTIYRIVIYHGYDGVDTRNIINDYTIDVSVDGVVFSTIFTIVNNTDFVRIHDSSIPISAKFVKINITRYTSTNRLIWMSSEEGHQYWKGATLREVEIYKYNGFSVLNSELTPIIAIDLRQSYFVFDHSLVGIDMEDAWTDWDNSNSNFTYSNSNLSEPSKVLFGEWGMLPDYERWVVLKRNTATKFPSATEIHPINDYAFEDAIPDYLKQIVINASSDELETKPNPTEYPWMWNSNLSKLSYDYNHTYSISRSLRIDYPASSGIEHIYNMEGDNLGVDVVASWRDGCGFSWYIDDIDNLDLTYGYFYLGGYDDTENQNRINYIWNLASISGSLQSGWNNLNLTFLYVDAIEYVLPIDDATLDVRRLYSVLWSKIGIVFRGKGNPIGMNFDGFSIARNHFEHSSAFDYGLYLHASDMLKVGVGGIDFGSCTIEFFIRPDWDWTSGDVLNDYKCRSLFHFSNTDNDVLGAIVTTEGLELYYGNITKNLNAFTILDSSETATTVIDTVFHIAFVFSNNGSGMSDNSTIRVYINNVLIAKSMDVWAINDIKHFNFIFGGQGLLFHRMVGATADVSAVDAVISNLKIFNYCKTNFDDSLNNNDDLENTGGGLIQPYELIEISSDNVTFHKVGSVDLPFIFREVAAGISIPIYVRTKIPKNLTGEEKRTAGVIGSWDIGV